jgi:lipopolysaccharide/colanic/teichoic acid biosynthesis glycosyltransferase
LDERENQQRLLRLGLAAADATGLIIAVGGAGLVRLVLDEVLPVASLVAVDALDRHVVASLLVVPVMLVLFWASGLYDLDSVLTGTREYSAIAHAASSGVLIALATSYFSGGSPLVSRSWLLLVWALSIAGVGCARFTARRIVRRLRRHGALRTRVVIVGASTAGVRLAEQLRMSHGEGLDVQGFLDEYLPLGHMLLGDLAVIGRPSDLLERWTKPCDPLCPVVADEYVLVPEALPSQRLAEITAFMESSSTPVVRLAVGSSELLTHGLHITERASIPLVTLRRARIGGMDAVLKSAVDRIGAGLALTILAPLALPLLARAWITGSGPLLYRYPINVAGGATNTLRLFGPDVTNWLPVRGAPALVAVLAGQLSLVGPRPTVRTASQSVPPALWLTAVKPGLTGPWRLSGPQASLSDQAIQDLMYVRNYTLWEDLRILWQSLRRLQGGHLAPLLGRWHARESTPAAFRHFDTGEPRVQPSELG